MPIFKKETFQTDQEYFPEGYCWFMVQRINNPSQAASDAKDMLIAFTNSTKTDSEFCNTVAIQTEKIINMIRNGYEKKWLYHLLDAIYVNKNMDYLNYDVAENIDSSIFN